MCSKNTAGWDSFNRKRDEINRCETDDNDYYGTRKISKGCGVGEGCGGCGGGGDCGGDVFSSAVYKSFANCKSCDT
ncbi:Hypothetical predicted protein [Octopus vulgaris]|uniref:Uncharacterized protein n=1 Tax=Octopus vulgaris TaxID=6645 RepID=A0AA36FED6_OCTVU|nr:Hypothetical predicted protein [Octopus vulgaris]